MAVCRRQGAAGPEGGCGIWAVAPARWSWVGDCQPECFSSMTGRGSARSLPAAARPVPWGPPGVSGEAECVT